LPSCQISNQNTLQHQLKRVAVISSRCPAEAYEPEGLGGGAAEILFFEQTLNFSGENQQLKIKKNFLYLLNEKTEFIPSSEMKCPKAGIFTENYWLGLSHNVIMCRLA